MSDNKDIFRRDFIKATGAGLFLAGLHCVLPLPAWALTANSGITRETRQRRYVLTIGYSLIRIAGREEISTGIKVRFRGRWCTCGRATMCFSM